MQFAAVVETCARSKRKAHCRDVHHYRCKTKNNPRFLRVFARLGSPVLLCVTSGGCSRGLFVRFEITSTKML